MSTGPAWHETMDRLAVKRWPSLREIRILDHELSAPERFWRCVRAATGVALER